MAKSPIYFVEKHSSPNAPVFRSTILPGGVEARVMNRDIFEKACMAANIELRRVVSEMQLKDSTTRALEIK